MFKPTVGVCIFFLFTVLSATLGRSSTPDSPSWLNQYQEHKQYGEVYVVKKIDVRCISYQSFLLDAQGHKLTPAYCDIGEFSGGLAEFVPFKEDGRAGLHGFIDKRGKVIVPPIYVATDQFKNGKTWVIYREGLQYGLSYIDSTGSLLYKMPVHHFKNDFRTEDASVDFVCNRNTKEDVIWWKKGTLFLLNWNFSRYIEKEIQESKGIYHFLYHGKYGIIDKNFVLKIPVALDDIDPEYEFSGQGMERVKYGDKYGFVNVHTGELVTGFEFSDTRKPTGGLFWVKKNNKWGCIDKTGKVRIDFLYDEATGFTAEGRSAVAINGKFGHIDKTGRVRTPLQYEFASYFNNGLSMIRINDKYGFMDTTGTFVIPVKYDDAFPFDRKTTIAERFGLRYELTLNGETTFAGFSDEWKAVFIMIALLGVVACSNYLFRRTQKRAQSYDSPKG
jgi:hypothetical protein